MPGTTAGPTSRRPPTWAKSFIDLRPGDVIVAPDGVAHPVREVVLRAVGELSFFTTTTGLTITYHRWFDAMNATYDVVLLTAPEQGEPVPLDAAGADLRWTSMHDEELHARARGLRQRLGQVRAAADEAGDQGDRDAEALQRRILAELYHAYAAAEAEQRRRQHRPGNPR